MKKFFKRVVPTILEFVHKIPGMSAALPQKPLFRNQFIIL
ncbi:hypothetical protein LEP1GSC020_2199 [Leptospira interrogans serovar Grippotyphosa str. 2006006986]|nr:hypothetical protein LEP1GSC007_3624 [Leptospira interrogans serovar Bulgarica str. Mallika]EKO87140.1 hypothetical protein LEP1GSC009_4583 [Leptospira interrogans serovar Grippotyphosa str. Andaman]EKP85390.1 hypothetical protein LEP1GSC020_2199 [Leptospira interrogans serovar Grippotyphosa str. 2006006986]EKR24740.1 hypothetical protein LEP1GSC087_1942 [Leptospira interrogans serovar Bataviae str. L1111]EMN55806.1 hypothetical protein LEP1GSC089_4844 [Leptospira interrogans serovar Autumna